MVYPKSGPIWKLKKGIFKVSRPPRLLDAHISVLVSEKLLRPLGKTILEKLERLMQGLSPDSWLTISLCVLVLLHNTSLTIATDARLAREYLLKVLEICSIFTPSATRNVKPF
jgi:hypothetical protein